MIETMSRKLTVQSQLDEGNYPMDTIELEGSDYDRIEHRRLDDPEDRHVLVLVDGDTETRLTFDEVPERYIGLDFLDGERRDLPEDVQDVLLGLGFAVKPDLDSNL